RNLAQFIAAADILALDRWLTEKYERARGKAQAVRVPCRVIERARGMRPAQIQFACVGPAGALPDIALSGWLEREDEQVVGGTFDRSNPSRSGVRDVNVMPAAIARTADGSEIQLILKHGGLKLRIADGSAVERVTLRWPAAQRVSAGEPVTGIADVWLLDDFAPVAKAIGEIADESHSGRGDAFTAQPFRRAAVMKALFAKLGMPARSWCCLDAADMPAPAVAEDYARGNTTPALMPFYRACAACHESRERFPPGFLHGGASSAVRNIGVCADRILYRLQMWSLPAEARPKTPMPPPAGLQAADLALAADLGEIMEYLKRRIRDRTGNRAGEGSLVAARYDELPRCAPVFVR
ncbi:MAG: hypothetical protein ACREUO_03065, partial [Burkholderiales bacterium]